MKKHNYFLVVFVVLFAAANTLLAQDWQGGSWTNEKPIQSKTNTTGPNEKDGNVRMQNDNNPQPNITPTSPQHSGNNTDEFAYFGQNAAALNFGVNATTRGAVSNSSAYYSFEDFDGSAECWVFFTSLPGTGTTLLSLGSTSNKSFGWYVNSAGQFAFRIGTTELVHAGTALPLNTWVHVAVTWLDVGATYTVTFYVNGVQSGATMSNGGTWNLGTSGDSLRIGRDESFTSSALNGGIDEVKYWESLRTLAQIRDNRFIGIGDLVGINAGNAITSSSHYTGLKSSWGFNIGNNPLPDPIGGTVRSMRLTGGVGAFFVQNGISIPYNFALQSPGGATSYVTAPHNAAYNLTVQGTMETWIYNNTATIHYLFGKGATQPGSTWIWGISGSGGLFFYSSGVQVFSNGPNPPLNTWYHLAVTWIDVGATYEIRFYVNGIQHGTTQSLALATFVTNADPLTLGTASGGFTALGYLDEMRIWSTARGIDQISRDMCNSVKSGTFGATCLAGWNFDGNLNNFGTTGGIGSFSTGGTNNCRFSGYINETTGGALSTAFNAHPTAVNRNITPNPFTGGFAIRAPNKPIPDVTITRDTITIGGPTVACTSVEVFLSIQHTFAADLDIFLVAPNGTSRELSTDNGGGSDGGYLTFFVDGALAITTVGFWAPFSNTAGPEVAMGTFGGTNCQGNWRLDITDDAGGDVGRLISWGIRLNGSLTGIQPVSNITPNRFNLYQNYPNPFNPVTNIKFDLPKDVNLKLTVYDILGREVKVLVNEFTKAGQYEVKFDASNIATGTYLFRIEAGDFVDTKKMVLIK